MHLLAASKRDISSRANVVPWLGTWLLLGAPKRVLFSRCSCVTLGSPSQHVRHSASACAAALPLGATMHLLAAQEKSIISRAHVDQGLGTLL